MASNLPLRMNHQDASTLADEIGAEIDRIAARYRRQGYATASIEAELTLVLGRACLRRGVDLLPRAAEDHINRLEVALAEAEAKVSRDKIAAGSVDGLVPVTPGGAVVRGIADAYLSALATHEVDQLIRQPGWKLAVDRYLADQGYQVASMERTGGAIVVDVIPLVIARPGGNGVHS